MKILQIPEKQITSTVPAEELTLVETRYNHETQTAIAIFRKLNGETLAEGIDYIDRVEAILNEVAELKEAEVVDMNEMPDMEIKEEIKPIFNEEVI